MIVNYMVLLAGLALKKKRNIIDLFFLMENEPKERIFTISIISKPEFSKNAFSQLLKLYHYYFKVLRKEIYKEVISLTIQK